MTEQNSQNTAQETVTQEKPFLNTYLKSGNVIAELEKAQMRDDIPEFKAGDTVVVKVNVVEGKTTRKQAFQGVVIAKKNRGLNSSFIVRKIASGSVGVERTFITHSKIIDSVEVLRIGSVRRAKLYYLRQLSGRKARIKEDVMKKVNNKSNNASAANDAAGQENSQTTES